MKVIIKYHSFSESLDNAFEDYIDSKYKALIIDEYRDNFNHDADELYNDMITDVHNLIRARGNVGYKIRKVIIDNIDIIDLVIK